MWTPKEIWEAGKAALAAKETTASAPLPPRLEYPLDAEVFDHSDFDFEDRAYRIHFKNGNSGEYHGLTLKQAFPFDPREITRIEPVEEVGQGL